MSDSARARPLRISAYARALVPAAVALSLQGGFAIAVMALDRSNRVLPSNLGYVILVEALTAVAILALFAAGLFRLRRGVSAALASPLDAESPKGLPGGLDESWRRLYEATKAAARAELASREAASKADLDDFLESVHALKTPLTALSLLTDRAEASGGSLRASDVRAELDQMRTRIDRAMARLRLVDFEKGSLIRAFGAAELARASLRRHRRLFIARSISAEVSGDFRAESDPDWISFILDQLVSNAAKHAASRVAIEISAASGRTPGQDRIDRAHRRRRRRAWLRGRGGRAGIRAVGVGGRPGRFGADRLGLRPLSRAGSGHEARRPPRAGKRPGSAAAPLDRDLLGIALEHYADVRRGSAFVSFFDG